jgi:hypothetical protein
MRRRAAAALGVVALVAGCTADPASLSGPEPWTDEGAPWMQPAGTPLGTDLLVPDGAQLVGPVFSTIGQRSPIDGGEWYVEGQQAYLLAEDDIVGVSDDLVEQLGGAGALEIDSGDTICNQDIDRGEVLGFETEPYTGDLDADAVEIRCAGNLDNGVSEPGGGTYFDLRQDVTEPDLPVQGIVSWSELDVQVPDSLPEAPDGVGGPETITTDVEGDADLEVAEGSFLAGPQSWGTLTGGFTAVIGATGDPDEVFDEYMRYQMKNPPKADEHVLGDLRVRQGTTGGAGGVTYTVTLNEIDGDAWILVEAYND